MVNVHAVNRDQPFLMPPSLAEWLPDDHLAWFVLDVVAELDLSGFYGSLRPDGRGGTSYDPQMMVGVLFYAYCVGERSSRRLERRLSEDVGFRVMAANQQPDHATLARFRRNHAEAIGELFGQVLGLCAAEGLIRSGWWRSMAPRSRRTLRRGRTGPAVRSQTRFLKRLKRSMLPRTNSLGNAEAMNCPRSGRTGVAGVPD